MIEEDLSGAGRRSGPVTFDPEGESPFYIGTAAAGAEFPDEGFIFGDEGHEFVVGDATGEGDAVIAGGPFDIMEVAADEAGLHASEPIAMVEEVEVGLELDVTEVVPIADVGGFDFVHELGEFTFGGDIFEAAATFDAQVDFFTFGVFDDGLKRFLSAFDIKGA
jgi:hypothetical protein